MKEGSEMATGDGDICFIAAVTYLDAIQTTMKRDRARGLAALNDLFRDGHPPYPPLNGRYAGQLVALDVAPGLTQLAQAVSGRWMPWQGKTFDAARRCGDNIFTRESRSLARIYWPFYRGHVDDGPATYRAFSFRTRVAPGLIDLDLQVLKIEYDWPANPRLTIRRVLDEVVQVAPDFYLGKAHLHWWWGHWQMVAYFSLVPLPG